MGKALVVFLILAVAFASTAGASQATQQSLGKPNVVFILTDDMRSDDLEHMPKTETLVAEQGVSFEDAFVTTSQCCPSRSSILRGQYMHNHGVKSNSKNGGGGWPTFEKRGEETSTVATWLHDAGYRTALVGKYLNQYDVSSYVPQGWDEWYAMMGNYDYYDYTLSENGKAVDYGSNQQDYLTDVLAGKTQDFVRRQAGDDQPFFLYFAPYAPHRPYTPASQYEGTFAGQQAPRPPSFNEEDVSDKLEWVQRLSLLGDAEESEVDDAYRKRLETLQSVDDAVEGIVNDLSAAGQLDNTYLVFSSDNGYLLGEHRIALTKYAPYEESIKVPLVIRGPGIPAGRATEQIALNLDLAPTFADIGGATTPDFVDGRSLKPTFASDAPKWRTAFLEEFYKGDTSEDGGGPSVPKHSSVRMADGRKYVKYATGEEEHYNLTTDPYELQNSYGTTDPELVKSLKARLQALKSCAGKSCRAADRAP
jgi:N-acetylglucosamine-6-sulfatase